jgi:RHS repeat-associated protein
VNYWKTGTRPLENVVGSGALEVLYAYVTKSWVPDWALHRDGRLFRVITDHVGSVRLVVDADSGEVAEQYRYSPYGVLEEDVTNESIVPHRFAGGHYDEATGLLRFGARDYDPQIGRWTNKDPLGFAAGDTNLYAYVGADPVNGVDPSGLFVDTLTDGIAVAGCLFALARDNIYGSCDNLGSNLGNVFETPWCARHSFHITYGGMCSFETHIILLLPDLSGRDRLLCYDHTSDQVSDTLLDTGSVRRVIVDFLKVSRRALSDFPRLRVE